MTKAKGWLVCLEGYKPVFNSALEQSEKSGDILNEVKEKSRGGILDVGKRWNIMDGVVGFEYH